MASTFPDQVFDIAPHASRPPLRSWIALAAAVLFAIACLWPLSTSWHALRQAQEIATKARKKAQNDAASERAKQAEMASPAAIQQAKAWEQYAGLARISWSGLFEALEIASAEVKGGVSMLSLAPTSMQPEGAELTVTALAADATIMLRYIETLRKIHPARRVELSLQQPEDKVGPSVIRFQLSVLWDPTALAATSFQSNAMLAKAASETSEPRASALATAPRAKRP